MVTGGLKFVLIDLDDTLFDFKTAEKSAFLFTLRKMGLRPTDEWAARYSAINDEMWKGLERGLYTRDEVKLLRYARLFREKGVSADAEEARKIYEGELSRRCPLMPNAREFLARASEGFDLYVITNGTARVQNSRLDLSGIRPYLCGVFISETIGFNKPDPRFFAAATSTIEGFDPRRALVVGDSVTSDIMGGINAGIPTCLVGNAPNGDIKPDYTVKDLLGLYALLVRLAEK